MDQMEQTPDSARASQLDAETVSDEGTGIAATTTTPDQPPVNRASLGWTLAATSLGLIVVQLDITIVNVALPHIGAQLGAAVGGLQWVVDAYTLAFAGLLLSAGAVGDRLGARGTYLLGILLFGLSSLACGIAPDTLTLIGARIIHGGSAAMVMATSLLVV